jgi:RimJ/RimL family protein N-acetyltransferase
MNYFQSNEKPLFTLASGAEQTGNSPFCPPFLCPLTYYLVTFDIMRVVLIKTDRLVIRHLDDADLENFYTYRRNPEVTKYQGFDVYTREQASNFIQKQKNNTFGVSGQWTQFAIARLSDNVLVGDCAIRLFGKDDSIAEIGITISHLEQKQGLAKEAMLGILSFLFKEKGVRRIQEIVDTKNEASIRLLESSGFKREGHFVENIFFKGAWGSEYQYALLKREWEETC